MTAAVRDLDSGHSLLGAHAENKRIGPLQHCCSMSVGRK
jgi:hypothetical protein